MLFFTLLLGGFNSSAQNITVTSPQSGVAWKICTVQQITWTFTGTSAQKQFNIDYSFDGGANYSSIASFFLATGSNSGSFNWTVPNTPSSNCIVRVSDANGSTIGLSNLFSIQTPLNYYISNWG